MNDSFQEFFPVVCPSLNKSLASYDSLEQLDNVSRFLPGAAISSDALLECHFNKYTLNTDISVALAKPNRHKLVNYYNFFSEMSKTSYLWKKINGLIEKWMDKASIIHDYVDNIWLEFDIDSESNVPEPSLFFHPYELEFSGDATNFGKYNWIIKEVLELLIDEPISATTKEYLSKSFNLLPPGCSVFQIGVMMPRLSESKAIRLCIKDIKFSEITKYLRDIDWIDLTQDLDNLLNELSNFIDQIAISISIENGIYSKIGLECYINKQPKFTSQWQMFFEFLLQRNLCKPEQINGLLEWPGYVEEKSFAGNWPSNLANASKFVYPNLRSAAARSIHHIKLVYQPLKPLEAKAYLWFGHRWIERNGSLQQ